MSENNFALKIEAMTSNMSRDQEITYANVVHMYESYRTGVKWWQIIDWLTGIGSLFTGLGAASLAKFSSDHNDAVALFALIAAVLAGIQKQLTPRNRLRMDWKGRSEMHQLRAELDADPNFDPIKATDRMNRIIRAHDAKFIT